MSTIFLQYIAIGLILSPLTPLALVSLLVQVYLLMLLYPEVRSLILF